MNKDESVKYILSQGLRKPPNFWGRILKIHRALGWRLIFWDLSYSFIFAAVTIAGVFTMVRHVPAYYPYSSAFGLSPVLFMVIMFFTEISQRACSLFELTQTCRYTSRQVAALRCMCYSGVGVVFVIGVSIFSAESVSQFIRLLPLCLGGMFLCAAIELFVMRLTRSKWAIACFSVVWLFASATPVFFLEYWERFLSNVPIFITIAFAAAGATVFLYQTNKMLSEENYVIA